MSQFVFVNVEISLAILGLLIFAHIFFLSFSSSYNLFYIYAIYYFIIIISFPLSGCPLCRYIVEPVGSYFH